MDSNKQRPIPVDIFAPFRIRTNDWAWQFFKWMAILAVITAVTAPCIAVLLSKTS